MSTPDWATAERKQAVLGLIETVAPEEAAVAELVWEEAVASGGADDAQSLGSNRFMGIGVEIAGDATSLLLSAVIIPIVVKALNAAVDTSAQIIAEAIRARLKGTKRSMSEEEMRRLAAEIHKIVQKKAG